MKSSQGSIGRVFILRLEDGDVVNQTIEEFARNEGVSRALAFYLGGSAAGSRLVVGPDAACDDAIVGLVHVLTGAPREVLAVGTLFPDESGEPSLHMHAAAGREGNATVGCTRAGLETWLVGEVVLLEILGTKARRTVDSGNGFDLLTLP
jgi:predicted DNA-binding protein with PD1-like motif